MTTKKPHPLAHGPNSAEVITRHVNALEAQADGGDLHALREALEWAREKGTPPSEALYAAIFNALDGLIADPKVIGKGPKATDKAAARRNAIDLQRWLAVWNSIRRRAQAGQKFSMKRSCEEAQKGLLNSIAYGGHSVIARSFRRIEEALEEKHGVLPLEEYSSPDVTELFELSSMEEDESLEPLHPPVEGKPLEPMSSVKKADTESQ